MHVTQAAAKQAEADADAGKDTIFDKIARKEIPCTLIYEDDQVLSPEPTHTRVSVAAVDVLRSWAIYSLGLNIDTCPDRLNKVPLLKTIIMVLCRLQAVAFRDLSPQVLPYPTHP